MRRVWIWGAVAVVGSAATLAYGACHSAHSADLRVATANATPIDDAGWRVFRSEKFWVYWRGEGPAVLIFHELPGLTSRALELGRRISEEHFTVFLPLMFGRFGESSSGANLRGLLVDPRFRLFRRNQPSPIVDDLRSLVVVARERAHSRKVGAIGMCLSGTFGIPLMRDRSVAAVVVSQPSLPFGWWQKDEVDYSNNDLDAARANGAPILAFRFSEDRISPDVRMKRLEHDFRGANQINVTRISSRRGNPDGIPHRAHAVFTEAFVDRTDHPTKQALSAVLDLFERTLRDAKQAVEGRSQ